MSNKFDNETYRQIHFAVMAIESGARKMNISIQDQPEFISKQPTWRASIIQKQKNG